MSIDKRYFADSDQFCRNAERAMEPKSIGKVKGPALVDLPISEKAIIQVRPLIVFWYQGTMFGSS